DRSGGLKQRAIVAEVGHRGEVVVVADLDVDSDKEAVIALRGGARFDGEARSGVFGGEESGKKAEEGEEAQAQPGGETGREGAGHGGRGDRTIPQKSCRRVTRVLRFFA